MPEIVREMSITPSLSTTTDDPDMPAKLAKEPPLSTTSEEVGPLGENVITQEATTETTPEPEPPAKPKKVDETPPWMKALISKEKNRAERAEADAAEARRLMAELLQQKQKETPQTVTGEPVEPNEADYADNAEYRAAMRQHTKAVAAWTAKRAIDEYDTQQRTAKMEAEAKRLEEEKQEFLDRGRSKYDDFSDKCEVDSLPITVVMFEAAKRAENGEDVIYFLGNHPSEAKRIAKLNPIAQPMEIALLSAKIEAAKEPAKSVATGANGANAATAKPVAPVSKAPAPIAGRTVGAKNDVKKDPEKMSTEEYVAWVRSGRP